MTTQSAYTPALQNGALDLGTILSDRYVVTRFIGKGGFALIYEAFDMTLSQRMAIKVLKPIDNGAFNQEIVQQLVSRFEREASVAIGLAHPHVVRVFGTGWVENTRQPFIAMEYLEGHDLMQELKMHGPMPAHRALPLICRVLSALAEGHAKGIVHKDLKPANLFLTHPGTDKEDIRVLDFGIAALDMEARLTAQGSLVGTPEYLAPEYIKSQAVSPALDVYQMGLILVELLSAPCVPSSKWPMACLPLHMSGRLKIPEALLACAPLRPVLMRALARDPAARYPDAGAFLHDLQRIDPSALPSPDEMGQAVLLCDAPESPEVAAPKRSWWVMLGVALLLALMLLMGIAGAIVAKMIFSL